MKNLLVIGAGKLGTSLFRAAKEKTTFKPILAGRKPFSSINSSIVSPGEYRTGISAADLSAAQVIIISVDDDQLGRVIDILQLQDVADKLFLHTAGAMSSEELYPFKKQGAQIGSFHPVQSFSRPFLPVKVWKGAICTYEGDEEGRRLIGNFCNQIEAKLMVVSKEQKQLLHLAAVFASNYMVSLLALAENLLEQADFAAEENKKLLEPIAKQVIENYKRNPLHKILSGPLQRGDINTIKMHLNLLKKEEKSYSELYKNLAGILLSDNEFPINNREQLAGVLKKI